MGKNIYEKNYIFEMSDNSLWSIPIKLIADSRADYYASHDGVSFEEALKETLEVFEEDAYLIHDWATNNMDWGDVKTEAKKIAHGELDLQNEWVNPVDWNLED